MAASGQFPNAQTFSFDQMIRQLPQMFSMAEDMHNLTEYINHLRILVFVLVAVAFVGGVGFLFYKLKHAGSRSVPCSPDEKQCFIESCDGRSPNGRPARASLPLTALNVGVKQ